MVQFCPMVFHIHRKESCKQAHAKLKLMLRWGKGPEQLEISCNTAAEEDGAIQEPGEILVTGSSQSP